MVQAYRQSADGAQLGLLAPGSSNKDLIFDGIEQATNLRCGNPCTGKW